MNVLRLSPYQQHVHRWQGCVKCPLHKGRDRMCFARGQVPCDILFVGEAPGESENVLGLPFVGPAGKLLDQIIEEAVEAYAIHNSVRINCEISEGTHRPHRIAFTNLVACYPAEAKQTDNHEPPYEALVQCRPRLMELLDIARPKLVVCVGGLASKWVPSALAAEPSVREWLDKLIDIIHPAAILRMPASQQALAIRRMVDILSQAMEAL